MTDSPSTVRLCGGPLDGREINDMVLDHYETQAIIDSDVWAIVRYERNPDGEMEYVGAKSIADIATQATQPPAEPCLVDLESMSVTDATAFLRDDNERRIAELLEATDGAVDLTNAFDILYVRTFVTEILKGLSTKGFEAANLAYEDERSTLIDVISDKYEAFQNEREAALARAKLAVEAGPPPGTVQHNGRITMPSRRVRRANPK